MANSNVSTQIKPTMSLTTGGETNADGIQHWRIRQLFRRVTVDGPATSHGVGGSEPFYPTEQRRAVRSCGARGLCITDQNTASFIGTGRAPNRLRYLHRRGKNLPDPHKESIKIATINVQQLDWRRNSNKEKLKTILNHTKLHKFDILTWSSSILKI